MVKSLWFVRFLLQYNDIDKMCRERIRLEETMDNKSMMQLEDELNTKLEVVEGKFSHSILKEYFESPFSFFHHQKLKKK